jgi:hypothetical protein
VEFLKPLSKLNPKFGVSPEYFGWIERDFGMSCNNNIIGKIASWTYLSVVTDESGYTFFSEVFLSSVSHVAASQNIRTCHYATFLTWIFLQLNFQLIQSRFIGRPEAKSVQKIIFHWHSAFNGLRNRKNILKCSSCVFRCIDTNYKQLLQLQ